MHVGDVDVGDVGESVDTWTRGHVDRPPYQHDDDLIPPQPHGTHLHPEAELPDAPRLVVVPYHHLTVRGGGGGSCAVRACCECACGGRV